MPNLGAYVVSDRSAKSSANEHLRDSLHPVAAAPRELAQRKPVSLNQPNNAWFAQGGGRINYAANDPLRIDMIGDDTARINALQSMFGERASVFVKIPPGNAVLHGYYHRLRFA